MKPERETGDAGYIELEEAMREEAERTDAVSDIPDAETEVPRDPCFYSSPFHMVHMSFFYSAGQYHPISLGGLAIMAAKIKWDARYFILLFLISFVFAGQFFLGFFQRWDSFFASVLSAVATELLLARILLKKWIFPLSAIISGIGLSLLLSSYLVWPYVLAAVLAIVMKYVIRIGGSHVFNPNNIAIVFLLFVLPQYAVSTPKQWTNGIDVMILILVLGFIAAGAAKRLDTVLAFVLSFVLFAALRHYLFGEPLYYAFGPMLGASFQLFTFFMITDPKTTAPRPAARMTAAFLIAFVDALFRLQAITNSLFYAAFIVTVLYGIPYRLISLKRRNKSINA
ncbi:RnfABCDGE type electron transport complex subunit D [Paenibacillus tyrfis]|uniref:RnfABCDGE type electron transport complex subunit D n=1 Tax=Paenibacillus tyrfis TaxID=1501230 RepID=UPI002166C0BE|nr:RnfABCDGE type electron transport complex subunit D [Paenibacillus tyrfis]